MSGPVLFWLITGVVAFGLALGLSFVAAALPIVDEPNGRSNHRAPVARTGGLAVAAAFWLALSLARLLAPETIGPPGEALMLIGLSALALGLGLADDMRLVRLRVKLGGQIALALLFALFVARLENFPLPGLAEPLALPAVLGVVITTLWIVGFVNVFNFMDGLNAMAGGVCAIALAFLASLAGFPSVDPVTAMAGIGAFAALGFLGANAAGRIFLGDSGSHFLAFLFATLVVLAADGTREAALSPLVGGALFAPFLLDAGVTLIRRAARGEKLAEAHREHLYQRLHAAGWSHLQVSALYAALGVGCGVGASVMDAAAPTLSWLATLGLYAVLVGIGLVLEKRFSVPAPR